MKQKQIYSKQRCRAETTVQTRKWDKRLSKQNPMEVEGIQTQLKKIEGRHSQ